MTRKKTAARRKPAAKKAEQPVAPPPPPPEPMRPMDANGGAELDSGGTHASTGAPLPDFSEREAEPGKNS
jgi:hypothetical protein